MNVSAPDIHQILEYRADTAIVRLLPVGLGLCFLGFLGLALINADRRSGRDFAEIVLAIWYLLDGGTRHHRACAVETSQSEPADLRAFADGRAFPDPVGEGIPHPLAGDPRRRQHRHHEFELVNPEPRHDNIQQRHRDPGAEAIL